jgi:hypothetical protein
MNAESLSQPDAARDTKVYLDIACLRGPHEVYTLLGECIRYRPNSA